MITWLLALLASSFTFAVADILCDICITEEHESSEPADEDELEHPGEMQPRRALLAGDEADEEDENVLEHRLPVTNALHPPADSSARPSEMIGLKDGRASLDESEEVGWTPGLPDEDSFGTDTLSGEQDAAVAGLVTTMLVVIANIYWGIIERRASYAGLAEPPRLRWGPFTHVQFWLAMVGGAMNFFHYYFLLKAFEGAPSTVLLPLVQVASVSVLAGSAAIAALRHEQWITPTHAVAYCLMFVGGVLPACGGHLAALLRPAFWRQAFVSCAILAEFALGMHDLMLSGCAYHTPAAGVESSVLLSGMEVEPAPDDSYEYFIWSRVSFVATFACMYSSSPRLYGQLKDLFSGRIAPRYISLSALSEGLTVLGFYLASIAYGLFYQAGVVHAAEASLSQLLNLTLAFLLLKCFGIGRPSAVGSMPAKVASFVLVTIGLFLCTLEDTHTPAIASLYPAVQGVPLPMNGTT